MHYKLLSTSLLLLVILCSVAVSQDVNSVADRQVRYRVSSQQANNENLSEIETAKQWRISLADWKRYKVLMQGPRGYWSPNLDPLTVLGVHAQSDEERARIANIQAQIEHHRLMQEMAYEKAYQLAHHRLLGGQKLFDIDGDVQANAKNNSDTMQTSLSQVDNAFIIGDRLLLFVDHTRCGKCSETMPVVLAKIAGRTDLRLDIYFVNTSVEHKESIQLWAKKHHISPEQLKSGLISLNYDMGTAQKIGAKGEHLPVLLLKRAGKYAKL